MTKSTNEGLANLAQTADLTVAEDDVGGDVAGTPSGMKAAEKLGMEQLPAISVTQEVRVRVTLFPSTNLMFHW